MKNNIDPDKILKNTPVPNVESGHHKPELKASLIESMSAPCGREVKRILTTRKALVLALIIIILSASAVFASAKCVVVGVTILSASVAARSSSTEPKARTLCLAANLCAVSAATS